MKKIIILFVILIALILTACTGQKDRLVANYYILNYIPHLDDTSLVKEEAYKLNVQMTETQLPRTYEKNKIVSKNSINTITYLENHVWADKLYNLVPQLLTQKTARYNFFETVQSDFSSTIPDYYIDTFISNIEQVETDSYPLAHVKMDMYLRNSKQQVIVVHRFNKEVIVNDYSINSVVQQMNEIILLEYDNFLRKIDDYFINGVESKTSIPSLATEVEIYNDKLIPLDYNDSKRGELVVPNLSKQDNAPKVRVMGIDNNLDKEIVMGDIVSLPIGEYTLYAGQQGDINIIKNIKIQPNYRTHVIANWGSLVVNIIDQTKSKVRMQYTIFTAEDNKEIASNFSVTDDAGDDNKVWILEPGRYFITVNGQPYSSYTDFYTMDVVAGQHYNLSLVVDETGTTSKLVGAGIHPQENEILAETYYSSQNAFHLNFNVSTNNSNSEKDFDDSITLSSQFDKKMRYERNRIDYEGRINWEMGFSKASEQDLQISNDNFSFTNTLIYNIYKKSLGFYGRYDVDSHFFPQYNYFSNNKNIQILDTDKETVLQTLMDKEKIKTQESLFPLGMKEGIGLNYRFTQSEYGSINLRAGLGWQQDYYDDYLVLEAADVEIEGVSYDQYREVNDLSKKGLETSLITNIKIPKLRVSWSSTADLLIPLEKDSDFVFDFDNIFNIKLVSNVSWDVRFNLSYDTAIKDYMVLTSSSFIRLSYFF